jgi:hypothetical protein
VVRMQHHRLVRSIVELDLPAIREGTQRLHERQVGSFGRR